MRYFIFYPTNDRCIHYLLCIDLLKIIAVPLVQLDLIEIIVLEQFLSFRRKQRGEMQLRPWLCFSICFLQCCLSCFLERLNPIWLTSKNKSGQLPFSQSNSRFGIKIYRIPIFEKPRMGFSSQNYKGFPCFQRSIKDMKKYQLELMDRS